MLFARLFIEGNITPYFNNRRIRGKWLHKQWKIEEATSSTKREEESERSKVALEATAGGSFIEMAGGIGAAVMGTLALIGFTPGILTLVVVLCIGSSELLSGSAVGGKMLTMAKSNP